MPARWCRRPEGSTQCSPRRAADVRFTAASASPGLRHQRRHLRHIARLLAAIFSILARALNQLRQGRLRNLTPKALVPRYERETPGDLIHIDVKKLARFRQVGHRITGNRQQVRSMGVGYDLVNVAINHATWLA